MTELRPGDVFVDHRIEGLAGRGGMGVVYRATQLGLDRLVALKVITPALAEEPDFRRRFVAESKAAASIEHPNVIPVHYAGEREGVLFIVMRYIDGPDLRALVRAEGRLGGERAAHIVAQVGAALDAAHTHGLVHRDVKPANVLLDAEDHAYLTDFGLTKHAATTDGGLSRSGGWVGTLGYVSPEQIRGDRVDARTDVYALGCVLVHALTGSAPYQRDSDEATLWAHLNSPPPTEDVPAEFQGVVARALAKDPGERYPSAGDLGRAALAAAGRSAAPGPERNVARGAAAPAGTPDTLATMRRPSAPDADAETRLSPPADGAAIVPAGGPPGHGAVAAAAAYAFLRRPIGLVAVGCAIVLGALAAFAIGGGEEPRKRQRAAAPPPPPRPSGLPPSVAEDPIFSLVTRPNSLTIARRKVWVLSNSDGVIALVDAKTSKPTGVRLPTGDGGTAVVAGFGSVWVAKESTQSLVQFNARTRRRVGEALDIGVPGQAKALAAGAGAVWVGVRNKGGSVANETIVRVDPSSLSRRSIIVPNGVQDLAVGEGAVWVSNRAGPTVTRIDTGDLRKTVIPVGPTPKGIAVGYDAVWVAVAGGDKLTRINPKTLRTRSVALKAIPERVAVGGGSVWATAKEAGRLIRIDPKRRVVTESIETESRPFALDVTSSAVWLTLLDSNAVQRVRFSR